MRLIGWTSVTLWLCVAGPYRIRGSSGHPERPPSSNARRPRTQKTDPNKWGLGSVPETENTGPTARPTSAKDQRPAIPPPAPSPPQFPPPRMSSKTPMLAARQRVPKRSERSMPASVDQPDFPRPKSTRGLADALSSRGGIPQMHTNTVPHQMQYGGRQMMTPIQESPSSFFEGGQRPHNAAQRKQSNVVAPAALAGQHGYEAGYVDGYVDPWSNYTAHTYPTAAAKSPYDFEQRSLPLPALPSMVPDPGQLEYGPTNDSQRYGYSYANPTASGVPAQHPYVPGYRSHFTASPENYGHNSESVQYSPAPSRQNSDRSTKLRELSSHSPNDSKRYAKANRRRKSGETGVAPSLPRSIDHVPIDYSGLEDTVPRMMNHYASTSGGHRINEDQGYGISDGNWQYFHQYSPNQDHLNQKRSRTRSKWPTDGNINVNESDHLLKSLGQLDINQQNNSQPTVEWTSFQESVAGGFLRPKIGEYYTFDEYVEQRRLGVYIPSTLMYGVKSKQYRSVPEITQYHRMDEHYVKQLSHPKITVLGEGVGGIVYKVKDINGEKLAMKCVPKHEFHYTEKGLPTSDIMEVDVQTAVRSPYSLAVIGRYEINNNLCWTMPYAKFKDGHDMIGQFHAKLPGDPNAQWRVRASAFVSYMILLALGTLHELEIAHHDLKPENIFFMAGRLVLADYGLAVNLRQIPDENIMGTINYLPPEYLQMDRKKRVVNQQTDIYSLGVILYIYIYDDHPLVSDEEMNRSQIDWTVMTNPFKSRTRPPQTPDDTWNAQFQEILWHKMQLYRDGLINIHYSSRVDGTANDFIRKCLHSDPKHRFQDVVEALEHPFVSPYMAMTEEQLTSFQLWRHFYESPPAYIQRTLADIESALRAANHYH